MRVRFIIGCCLFLQLESGIAKNNDTSFSPWHKNIHPIIAITGGASFINNNHLQSYQGDDEGLFIYHNKNQKTVGLISSFLGAEFHLPCSGCLFQAGIEYLLSSQMKIRGLHSAGNELDTATFYNYRYNYKSQALFATAKLLLTHHQIYHPYTIVSLGSAFYKTGHYNAATSETDEINLTPIFDNARGNSFAYSVGFGVDTTLNNHLRLGIGYRFSDFGKHRLGNGQVVFNDYVYPTPFTLSQSHNYNNEVIAQLTYLI